MHDILVSNISKNFGDLPVFSGFSHVFPAGQVSCILGPSGSGKTTLLRMLAGLEAPDAGEICCDARRISFVFQENRLFENLSAEKNVLLTARPGFTRSDAQSLLERLGLGADAQRRTGEFSGGMQRRTALARALAADYELMLMDEPLSGLDGDTRRQVLDAILDMCAGRTVICVTHDPADAHDLHAQVLHLGRA